MKVKKFDASRMRQQQAFEFHNKAYRAIRYSVQSLRNKINLRDLKLFPTPDFVFLLIISKSFTGSTFQIIHGCQVVSAAERYITVVGYTGFCTYLRLHIHRDSETRKIEISFKEKRIKNTEEKKNSVFLCVFCALCVP